DACVKDCDESLIAEKDKPTERLDPKLQCSFCGKRQAELEKLLKGPKFIYICNECVDLCDEVLEEDRIEPWASSGKSRIRQNKYLTTLSREALFEEIVEYVYSRETWKNKFQEAMKVRNITVDEVEAEVQRRLKDAK